MSIHIMSLVWERAPYEGGTLLLLLALADWANEEGVTWPSVAQIASKSRMKVRNAQYVLRSLEADGMLAREEVGKGRSTTVYRINIARLNALPVAWQRPSPKTTENIREQNEIDQEFVPMQNLHGATECTSEVQPNAPLPCNDCTSALQPIAPLPCSPLHPIRHRSVIEPSGESPTPAELGSDLATPGESWEQKKGTPREQGTNPRALGTNPRQVASDTLATCQLCDIRGQVELRRDDDTVVMLRCPHDRDTLRTVMAAHGYRWPHDPPGNPTALREGDAHAPWTHDHANGPPDAAAAADPAGLAVGHAHPSGPGPAWPHPPPAGRRPAGDAGGPGSRDQPPLCLQVGEAVSGAGLGGLARPATPQTTAGRESEGDDAGRVGHAKLPRIEPVVASVQSGATKGRLPSAPAVDPGAYEGGPAP